MVSLPILRSGSAFRLGERFRSLRPAFLTLTAPTILHNYWGWTLWVPLAITAIRCGGVAQLVRASACHAEGRGFEPRHSRHFGHKIAPALLGQGLFYCLEVAGVG